MINIGRNGRLVLAKDLHDTASNLRDDLEVERKSTSNQALEIVTQDHCDMNHSNPDIAYFDQMMGKIKDSGKSKILIFVHGGLNTLKGSLERVEKKIQRDAE